ncbi:unnamed protein product [Gongylonema pulchrum]|uniref:Secreted protein n=1 Tax=Gongylonema pulchrum TaxID=637853 RepID=A0A183ER31_9BILA|nr:unnamed protein product [Gongylonema pulchrum]
MWFQTYSFFFFVFSVPTKILAHLLSARGICEKPFEIKIDNIRFAGFPKTVSNPTARSPQTFHVVFVLLANAAAHLVASFLELSRKIAIAIDEEQTRCDYLGDQMIAIAIDEEQTRCDYLGDQMVTMLNDYDKSDSLSEGNFFFSRQIFPFQYNLICLA